MEKFQPVEVGVLKESSKVYKYRSGTKVRRLQDKWFQHDVPELSVYLAGKRYLSPMIIQEQVSLFGHIILRDIL